MCETNTQLLGSFSAWLGTPGGQPEAQQKKEWWAGGSLFVKLMEL